MKKVRSLLFTLLAAVCVVCVAVAFSACGSKEKSGSYGAGEEGFYYYDGANSERYMLSLQSGTYMITANGETAYSGSYSYNEESGEISFTSGDEKFTATVGENALSLDMTGSGYSFKAYKYFPVTYVDENGEIIATKSVLNGQSAEELDIEKDGYWFIGWYEDSTNSSEFAFNTSIAGDTFVYGWYIEKNPQATEYVITLDFGDGESEVWNTTNGAVYKSLPEINGSGENILGWWVSATNNSGELTYKYSVGDVFTSDTTLFAVYDGIGASVTKEGITWDSSRAGANVSIEITDENGKTVLSANPSSSSGSYTSSDFTALGTGVYTVAVGSDSLTYVVNGLDRVSKSSMDIITNGDGKIISFAPVENASGYIITVDDGEKSVTEDLGSRTYYNLSSWEMTEVGLTITITAYADGFVSSVSDEYSYLLKLEKVTLEMSGDDFVWSRVDGALEYEVKIYGEDGDVLESFYTTETSYSLKYYDAGTYTISVKPVTSGYWSEEQFIYGQAKSTIAAPVICDITHYTISWTEVDGAVSYVVMINGTEYTVTGGATTLAFSEYGVPEIADSYEISVMAVADSTKGLDSSYSDTVTATNGGFKSSVRYEKNTVYWDYDVSATKYVVSVNDVETTIENGNSAEITLNKAGNNEIIVTAYGEEGSLGQAEIDVYAYTVTLDPNGAKLEGESVLYVAQGDVLNLGEVTKDHANFVSWYTQADYTDGQSDVYEGKGSEVENGSVFTGSRDMYLYAYWSYEYLTVNLYLDAKTLYGTVQVKYNTPSYVFPVVASSQDSSFVGWFEYANGVGKQFTSYNGEYSGFGYGETYSLYAYFMPLLSYSKTTYNGETVYAVSANTNVDVSLFPEIEIPAKYTVDGTEYDIVLNSDAFDNCTYLVSISIPDTVKYIAVTNDGYRLGTGAFARCSSLEEVNIYSTGFTNEPMYFSEDGVLFHKLSASENGDVELLYYPYAKATGEYVIPTSVSNENEYVASGNEEIEVLHYVTYLPSQIFRDRKMTSVVIPVTVTEIASQAFYDNTFLTCVIFEEGGSAQLTMADRAFRSCNALEEITLPARYAEINAAAFTDCAALINVYIEEGADYISEGGVVLNSNGDTVVYYPTGRSGDVVISDISVGITTIGERSFSGNTKITSVEISASVTLIGKSAFEDCTGINSLVFNGNSSSGDLTIKTNAFYGCRGLRSVELPQNLTKMEKNAFGSCVNLKTVYFDTREGATGEELDFAESSFGSPSYITTLKFGANVPTIDFVSIFGNDSLLDVKIEAGNASYFADDCGAVYNAEKTTIIYYPALRAGEYELLPETTTINSSVFAKNTGLTSIKIGTNVNTIGADAFAECSNLAKIIVDPSNVNYGNIIGEDGESDGILYAKDATTGTLTELIYCPIANPTTDLVVPETVVKVAANAFYKNANIINVEFKATESFELGQYAFYYCGTVESIVLPDCLEKILTYTFYRCTNLKYINAPTSLVSIGDNAFRECNVLVGDLTDPEKGMKLPEGLETVGENAFYNAYTLAVTIPSTVTNISGYGFYGCWQDKSVDVGIVFAKNESGNGEEKGLTIGGYAFRNTKYATSLEIPARVTSIGDAAFEYFGASQTGLEGGTTLTFEKGCQIAELGYILFSDAANIKKIIFPSSLKTLGTEAFADCSGLESVSFAPEGETPSIEKIGIEAFSGTALTGIQIPASVTEISDEAFYNTSSLKSINFEEGTKIKTIGNSAFSSTGLTDIQIPESVTSLGYKAFNNCSNLKSISFQSEEGTSGITTIQHSTFYSCTSLETVNLPKGLKKLGTTGTNAYGVFYNCTSLGEILIPSTVEVVDYKAFDGCSNLTKIDFGENSALEQVGDGAFNGCTSLTSFVFPESTAEAITLGSQIFNGSGVKSLTLSSNINDIGRALEGVVLDTIIVAEGNSYYSADTGDNVILYYVGESSEKTIAYTCGTLTGTVSIPEGVTAIASSAYYGQTGIEKVELPTTVISIGSYAFYGCKALKTINLPSTLAEIPDYCFYNCDLSETCIPDSVTKIGDYALYGTKLTDVELSNIPTLGKYAFATSAITSVKLGNLSTMGTYAFYNCTSLKEVVVEGNIGTISQYAFSGCSSLASFEFPKNLVTIDAYAFQYCVFETIDLPASLETIGNYAFRYSGLVYLEIPAKVTSIGTYTFRESSSLKNIIFPDGLESIGNYVLYSCSSLETCVLPKNLKTLGTYVFYKCTALTSIDLPDSLTSMGSDCFEYTGLRGITMGSKLTSIGGSCFRYCSDLESAIVGANVTSIGTYVFASCTSLLYAYTGDSAASLGNYMFDGCTSLETVEFGMYLSSVGTYVFRNCTSLKGVVLEAGLTSIGSQAFASCTSLEYLIIPSTVSSIGSSAFTSCSFDIYVDVSTEFMALYWDSGWDGGFTGNVYIYSETEPNANDKNVDGDGSFWHYDEDGEVAIWTKDEN